jgi:hypothetical protein
MYAKGIRSGLEMAMLRVWSAALVLGAMMGAGGESARADSMWDVAAARANARAGGPISAYDAELLDHWGCLSGTKSAFCKRIRHGANSAGGDRGRARR